MPDLDQDAYTRATAGLDELTDAYGKAGVALVDAHWQAIIAVVREYEEKAVAVLVTPLTGTGGGRARLLFPVTAILPDRSIQPLPTDPRLDRHLHAIYAVAGVDEFDDDHSIDGEPS